MKLSFNFALIIILFSAVFSFAQETGGVKGKIKTMNGSAIADATVTARQNGKDIKSVKSDGKGSFTLSGLAAGVYNFVFEKDGFATGIKYDVEIAQKKVRDLGSNLRLNVDPGMQTIIKGIVFDQNGKSISGVKVDVEKKQSDGQYKKISQTTSSFGNDDSPNALTPGEFGFRFAGGAATYRVTAAAKDYFAQEEIIVTNAAIYRVSLTLKPNNK